MGLSIPCSKVPLPKVERGWAAQPTLRGIKESQISLKLQNLV